MSEQRYERLDRRYARAFRWGLLISVIAHLTLFLVFDAVPMPPSPFAAAGDQHGDDRAALGGGLQTVELRSPRPTTPSPPVPEEEAEEEVVDEVEPQEPETEDLVLPEVQLADRIMMPGAQGTMEVPGLERGTGEGAGGTEAEGRSGGIPPRPRGLILPPGDRPDEVRGKEVEVWVYVTARGKVVPDSTRLNPPTGDRRFDRRLRDHAAGWVFEAARRDGRAVAEWFRYTIIM